jgi:hypothetical protein
MAWEGPYRLRVWLIGLAALSRELSLKTPVCTSFHLNPGSIPQPPSCILGPGITCSDERTMRSPLYWVFGATTGDAAELGTYLSIAATPLTIPSAGSFCRKAFAQSRVNKRFTFDIEGNRRCCSISICPHTPAGV